MASVELLIFTAARTNAQRASYSQYKPSRDASAVPRDAYSRTIQWSLSTPVSGALSKHTSEALQGRVTWCRVIEIQVSTLVRGFDPRCLPRKLSLSTHTSGTRVKFGPANATSRSNTKIESNCCRVLLNHPTPHFAIKFNVVKPSHINVSTSCSVTLRVCSGTTS